MNQSNQYTTPQFESFAYRGNDARYDQPFDAETHFLNPVISGTNPDPAICRKGDDFYMANSSFVYWPGIPIWHSKDLIDWDFCGYVIDRPSQAFFADGSHIAGGVFAPDIKYCEKNQTFYLIVTIVTGSGNVIFKTQDPRKGWSEPIPVPEVHGIDPSFLFDTDGKCYIVNNDEPAYPAEYSGHRAIWGREYDLNTDKVCSEPVVLIDKGIRPAEKPIWIEGPHLYHIGQQYFLMDAEGGTGDWHSEVVLSGRTPLGKFTPSAQNPILTQRTQPHDRPNAISCAGHADLVYAGQTLANGAFSPDDWWSVFLACTTYDGDQLYNTGRSTFLLPVSWQKDRVSGGIQPLILHPDSIIPTVCAKQDWQREVAAAEGLSSAKKIGNIADGRNLLRGNGAYRDDFDESALYPLWFTLRTPTPDQQTADDRLAAWYNIAEGRLQLTGRNVKLGEQGQPSMLCRWVKNATYTAQTRLLFTPQDTLALAGLTLFQSERAYYIFGKRLGEDGQCEVVLLKSDRDAQDQVIGQCNIDPCDNAKAVELRAEVDQHTVQFSFSLDNGATWTRVADAQNADILTTNYAGGFTGSVVGLYSYKK
ncbi:MAG: glycoside hydrolase family 43 protein [Bacteroidales bacterium]|nr:glycoside hydrolase family 43 protein [Bacteroidales bacterium]